MEKRTFNIKRKTVFDNEEKLFNIANFFSSSVLTLMENGMENFDGGKTLIFHAGIFRQFFCLF
jgi:hypothetical protein